MVLPAFAPGDKLPAADLQSLADGLAVGSDSSVGVAAAGFTDGGSFAITGLGGLLIVVRLFLNVTTTIVASGGNIPDTTCFTLDVPYRPAAQYLGLFDNGNVMGGMVINGNGTCVLRTASGASIAAGTSINALGVFMVSS